MGLKKTFKKFKESKFFGALKGIAPIAASLIGGPIGPLVVATINGLTGNEVPDFQDEAEMAAYYDKHPEMLLKLKELDVRMEEIAAENNLNLEELAFKDRDSARQMNIALQDGTPKALAFYAISLFTAIVGVILYGMLVGIVLFDPITEKFIYFLLGVVGGWVMTVFQFYFGSSKGSLIKTLEQTETLQKFLGKGGENA
jgi:hypothetical protein